MTRLHAVRVLAAVTMVAASLLGLTATAHAQTRPFPSKATYEAGFVPSAVTAAVVESSYTSWKSAYLKTDCGSDYARVDNATGNGSTFSEGQGYGMVLTAYFGDKTAFDELWAFAQKNFDANGIMGWHVTCAGPTSGDGGSGSATDGDTDIGFALMVASVQWGGSYASEARTYLKALKKADFTNCSPSGRNIPTDGDWEGTAACSGTGVSSSYFMPAYYRAFATFTGDTYWSKAADDVETVWGLDANARTGITIDIIDQNGAPVGAVNSTSEQYNYDTCRNPWRAALDANWYGNASAKTLDTKLTAWAKGVGITKIVDGYEGDGTATGQYTGMNAFVGGFAVGAMLDSQSLADSFAESFVGIANDNGTYYGSSLRTLYLLQLGGFEWNPVASAPVGAGDGGSGSEGAGDAGAGNGATGDGGASGSADSDGGAARTADGGSASDPLAGETEGAGAASDNDDASGNGGGGCAVRADDLHGMSSPRSGRLADTLLAALTALAIGRRRRAAKRRAAPQRNRLDRSARTERTCAASAR